MRFPDHLRRQKSCGKWGFLRSACPEAPGYCLCRSVFAGVLSAFPLTMRHTREDLRALARWLVGYHGPPAMGARTPRVGAGLCSRRGTGGDVRDLPTSGRCNRKARENSSAMAAAESVNGDDFIAAGEHTRMLLDPPFTHRPVARVALARMGARSSGRRARGPRRASRACPARPRPAPLRAADGHGCLLLALAPDAGEASRKKVRARPPALLRPQQRGSPRAFRRSTG